MQSHLLTLRQPCREVWLGTAQPLWQSSIFFLERRRQHKHNECGIISMSWVHSVWRYFWSHFVWKFNILVKRMISRTAPTQGNCSLPTAAQLQQATPINKNIQSSAVQALGIRGWGGLSRTKEHAWGHKARQCLYQLKSITSCQLGNVMAPDSKQIILIPSPDYTTGHGFHNRSREKERGNKREGGKLCRYALDSSQADQLIPSPDYTLHITSQGKD